MKRRTRRTSRKRPKRSRNHKPVSSPPRARTAPRRWSVALLLTNIAPPRRGRVQGGNRDVPEASWRCDTAANRERHKKAARGEKKPVEVYQDNPNEEGEAPRHRPGHHGRQGLAHSEVELLTRPGLWGFTQRCATALALLGLNGEWCPLSEKRAYTAPHSDVALLSGSTRHIEIEKPPVIARPFFFKINMNFLFAFLFFFAGVQTTCWPRSTSCASGAYRTSRVHSAWASSSLGYAVNQEVFLGDVTPT